MVSAGAELPAAPPDPATDPQNIIERFDVSDNGKELLQLVPGVFRPFVERMELFGDRAGFLVPVRLGGKKYLFLLDTGASWNGFDQSLGLRKPKQTVLVNSFGGKVSLQTFDAPQATLGRFNLRTAEPVVGTDLAKLRDISGEPIFGIVGMAFLKRHVMHLDPGQGTVFFLKSAGPEAGTPFRLIHHQGAGTVCVVAEIPGWGPELFKIDTGLGTFAHLRKDLYKALVKGGSIQPRGEVAGWDISGVRKTRTGRLASFALGPVRHHGVKVEESQAPCNVLGLGFFARHVVTFDFPRRTMYVKGSCALRPQRYDASGLILVRRDASIVVENVAKGSPADRGGVQPGDVLLRVGGWDVSPTFLPVVRYLLGAEGKHVTLRLQRGERQQEAALHLKEWRPKPEDIAGKPDDDDPAKIEVASLYWNRGLAYHYLGKFDKAIADFDKAIRLDPKDAEAYAYRGVVRLGRKQFDRAVADLSEAIRLKPKDPGYWYKRAEAHLLAGRIDAGRADLDECIRLAPTMAVALLMRAQVHLRRKDYGSAFRDADDAAFLEPDNALVHLVKGSACIGERRYGQAIQCLDEAIRLDGTMADAFFYRGVAHYYQQDTDRGILDFSQTIRLGTSGDPRAYVYRGSAYKQKREYAGAIADFREAVRLDPTDAFSSMTLAALLASCPDAKLRDGSQARKYAERALELTNRKDPRALEALAAAYAECGDFKQAVHWQEKALEFAGYAAKYGDEVRERLALYQAKKPFRWP
jgi:tetratricopeptide (TPR) repeat protein